MIKKTYSIPQVLALKNKICADHNVRGSLGELLVEEELNYFFQALRRVLPKDIPPESLLQSVRHLSGLRLTEPMLRELAWRLAGNVPRLRQGHAAPPWNRQAVSEYVPVEITSVHKLRRFGQIYAEWTGLILAGTPVGLSVTKTWSLRFCRAVSQRFGFSKPWGGHPFNDPAEFYGLRMYVLIDPQHCGSSPGFADVWYDDDGEKIKPGSCFAYNQELIRIRYRVPGVFECPQGYPDSQHCYLCPQGTEHCLAATHPRTYEPRRCETCQTDDAYFDPAFPRRTMCVDCHQRQQLRRED